MGRLTGKVALVTGAATGLGAAAARLFAQEGAKVALTDRNKAGADAAARAIGEAAVAFEHDVTDAVAWKQVVGATVERFGGLSVLMNNAGIFSTPGVPQEIETISMEEWRRINAVNIDGVMLGCQAAIPAMRASGGGSIVNISSLSGIRATPTAIAYGASKGAVRQFTKSIAVYCGRNGDKIRCNSIHPSLVLTEMGTSVLSHYSSADPKAEAAKRAASSPLGDLCTPEDIAYAALFLASDESRYITGIELLVDGGASCGR